MTTRATLHASLLAALLGAISLALSAAPAHAAARDCPATRGTIATTSLGRIWHRGSSLYGCTTVYGHGPRAVRLGPWSATTRAAWDGVNAVWTIRVTAGGQRVDRIWAANADSNQRWLKGARLVPRSGSMPAREARAQLVLQRDQGAAWVTQSGEVVLALRAPQSDPLAIGTPPAALAADHQYLLLGRWASAPASALAASAKLVELSGDGDECGAVNPYELTVQPDLRAPATGARWDGYWQSTNCR